VESDPLELFPTYCETSLSKRRLKMIMWGENSKSIRLKVNRFNAGTIVHAVLEQSHSRTDCRSSLRSHPEEMLSSTRIQ
jgi:hypothetical protein